MEEHINWLADSRPLLIAAVSERNLSRLAEVLAAQRDHASALGAHLGHDARNELLASLQQARLLADLQRAHILESVKDCQHQLAILQTYAQNPPGEAFEESRG